MKSARTAVQFRIWNTSATSATLWPALACRRLASAINGIVLDGKRFVRPNAWGHLLNQHYLYPIADAQRHGRRHGGSGTSAPFVLVYPDPGEQTPDPRLFAYINGGSPA